MTLQEKTQDAYVEHTVEVHKFSQSQKKVFLSELTFVLNNIKKELLKGSEKVNLTEMRDLIRKADRLFKEGFALIENNLYGDADKQLAVELEGQVELLQSLLDDFNVDYTARTPNYNVTRKRVREAPIENMPIEDWLSVWETKTSAVMRSDLLSEFAQSEDGDRVTIVNNVFGKGNQPLNSSTFLRPGIDFGALVVSLADSVSAETTQAVGQRNPGIIIGMQWNSCLCATTCARCASLHGSIRYFNGEDQTDGNEIPLHPNCLCHWVYLYANANRMDAVIPKEDRKNINSTEEIKKFPVWYNSISEKRKIDLFGKTRVKLLDNGSIKINQLLTRKNRRLYTLEELSKKGYRVPET